MISDKLLIKTACRMAVTLIVASRTGRPRQVIVMAASPRSQGDDRRAGQRRMLLEPT
jgi:hypothetical protein